MLLGTPGEQEPASIRNVITVPGPRPRDRASAELAGLRAVLLEGLGVATHHTIDVHAAVRPTRATRPTLTTENHR